MAVIAPAGCRRPRRPAECARGQGAAALDRNAAAGALIERTRAQGVVVGGGDERLRLEYVSEVADVVVGDVVVTSGIDGIFPKGFVIGRVASVERTGGMSRRIIVAPAVDFDRLEDVLVVLTPPPDASMSPRARRARSNRENRRDHPGGDRRRRAADDAGALRVARRRWRSIWCWSWWSTSR